MAWNPRSLNNKIEKFVQLLEDNDIQVAAISETWLTSSSNYVTGYLRERGYDIHHHHRDHQKGGGVALVFLHTLKKNNSKCYSYRSFECVSISFTGLHGRNLVFIVLYRCGDEPMSLFLTEFNDFIEYLHFAFTDFILCGDFNVHCNDLLNPDVMEFYQILNAFKLNQLVNEATHERGNTIDLVIHNPEQLTISDLNVCSDTPSDHSIIFFKLKYNINLQEQKVVKCRKLNAINLPQFNSDLTQKLDDFQLGNFPGGFKESVLKFNQIQYDLLNSYAPESVKTVNINNKPKWMDGEFKDARAMRRKYYKTWRRTGLETDREIFVNSRSAVAQLVEIKKRNYYAECIANCKDSQRELFKVCNNLLDKTKCSLLPTSNSPIDLANRFNSHFCNKIEKIRNAFTLSNQSICPNYMVNSFPIENATLDTFETVNNSQLLNIIKSAPIKTAPDDPIPAILLRGCLDTILPILVYLVNMSLLTGEMDGLKESVVTPLLKKAGADPEELANYRPITGIKYLGKLIERAALPQLNHHMISNKLHIPNQSGYKSDHSCETLLVRVINDILLNLDVSKCTVLLLLDLSAAFDTVDHDILLDILFKEIGLRDTVLKWFSSFLKGRRQAITINGVRSDYRDNQFGVPQGSVLGPVLFNIYVRSFIQFLESNGFSVHGYADDHQVFKSFRIEFQFSTIRSCLPKCLELVSMWMKKFFLKLNASKSQVVIFSPNSQSSSFVIQRVILADGSLITISKEAMNLGILLDSNLSFAPHIDMVISHCYMLLRDISSIRKFLSTDDIKSLVNSIVVARIDNGNSLFAGLSSYQVSRLQRLQNSCARVIYGARRRDHVSGLLKQLHWLPVRQRIIFKVLCLIFKCLHKTAPSYLTDTLPGVVDNRFVRIPRTRSSYGDRAFSRFGPIYWNALPTSLIHITNIDNFKAKLKHYLFSASNDYFKSLNRYRNWISF